MELKLGVEGEDIVYRFGGPGGRWKIRLRLRELDGLVWGGGVSRSNVQLVGPGRICRRLIEATSPFPRLF